MLSFIQSILAELIVAVIVFALGFFTSRITYSIQKRRFRRFFGEAVVKNDVKVVYGMISPGLFP